jgi:hypothetical protein
VVRSTLPPAFRTSSTVVTPTCPWGIDAASSTTLTLTSLSTDIPVTPLGWVPVPRTMSAGRFRPPRTTNASSGIFSTLTRFPSSSVQSPIAGWGQISSLFSQELSGKITSRVFLLLFFASPNFVSLWLSVVKEVRPCSNIFIEPFLPVGKM